MACVRKRCFLGGVPGTGGRAAVCFTSTGSVFRQELLPRVNRLKHSFEWNFLTTKECLSFIKLNLFFYLQVDSKCVSLI